MATDLREAMTSGVMVDVQDALGNLLAQAVFVDWRGRPVPGIGDAMSCDAVSVTSGCRGRVRGIVRARSFDVQTESGGGTAVWVHVSLELVEPQPAAPPAEAPYRGRFSRN